MACHMVGWRKGYGVGHAFTGGFLPSDLKVSDILGCPLHRNTV